MWLFTKFGFYSVVTTSERVDEFQVRARKREELVALQKVTGVKHKIIATPKRDYQFRMIVSREEWVLIAEHLAREVDYGNFKNELRGAYHDAALSVWQIMDMYGQT